MHRLLYWGIALVLTTLSGTSEALVLSGSFSGIAEHSRMPPNGNFDGSAVTGTFHIDIPDDYFAQGGSYSVDDTGTSALYNIPPGSLDVVFNAVGQSWDFDSEPCDYCDPTRPIQLTDDGTLQSVFFVAGDYSPSVSNYYASLRLAGPSGSLFNDLNLLTLHPGPVDLGQSSASFSTGRMYSYGADVVITQLSFDGYSPPPPAVPEPATWTALLAGLGAWWAVAGASRLATARRVRPSAI
ncbi:PEP-CTERM sorting domain-containing protein [Candidatus Methylocalor cossyra]|uniref:PEP-CTERM protein-sorting domain-containing protein n=1 Tax=Candidatus Methylocalor cossyra TaxID=3108543 RepID=A0ABP1C969_9GAMM